MSRTTALAVGMVALFAVFFVVHAWPHINARFGDSHDGRNAATWSLASRAIRGDGLLESRGGSHLADRAETYAHHPPLIIAETTIAEGVVGEKPWATRLAAWLGSLVTLALVYVLLRRRGMRPVACAGAIVVVFGSQMFLVYGVLLDTLQISLPFAAAFMLVWLGRAPRDEQTAWPVAVLGALLVLASWEGALMVGVVAVFDIVQRWRRDRKLAIPPSATGLLIGLGVTATWLWWAEGSFAPIVEEFRTRTGDAVASPGVADVLRSQIAYLGRTFSTLVLVVALPGIVLALRDPRLRRLTGVLLVVTITYPVVLHHAAYNHDYWNYWLLLTFAVAVVAIAQTLLDAAARNGQPLFVITACALVAVSLAAAVAESGRSSVPAQRIAAGERAGAIARDHGSAIRFLAGNQVVPARWFTYYTGESGKRLDTVESLQRAADRSPNASVLLKCGFEREWLERVCSRLSVDAGGYTTIRVQALSELARSS